MKTITKFIYPAFALFTLAYFTLSPAARAVTPAPDGADTEDESMIGSPASSVGAAKKKKGKKPRMTVSASPTSINEGQTAAYTIHASKVNPTQPITVNYSMSGSAVLGTHYALDGITGQAVVPAGSSSATVTLSALGTNLTTGSETAVMTLISGNGYQLKKGKKGKNAPKATITINNVYANTYTGPYPVPETVSYTDNGQNVSVLAYPGQVLVFFNLPTSETDAQGLIGAHGGTILGTIPQHGDYLVQVAAGAEAAFISAIEVDLRVYFAVPNGVGYLAAAILDGCTVSHSDTVKDGLVAEGGTFDGCWNIATNESDVAENQVADGIITTTSDHNGGMTLLNLSASGGFNGQDYFAQSPADQQAAEAQWKLFMRVTLASVASLPNAYRENLVLTIAAGNGHMPIDPLLADLRQDPKIAGILRSNVLVATTNRYILANTTNGDPDVAIMTNALSAGGTSFAAPAALAYIQNIMAATGANPKQALLAAKEAVATNASHQLSRSEAIDKARAIVSAQQTDPPGAVNITTVAFTSVGANTSAVITPILAGVTVSYTVSGTDGYYDSGTLPTNASGSALFYIPAGDQGITDTISVTAVLSGRTATTHYTWP